MNEIKINDFIIYIGEGMKKLRGGFKVGYSLYKVNHNE